MLYANTDDGSSALWVLDDDGVVVDNISYSIADRAPILAQINEHYGTSFTGWSDNEIGLRIGDTLPDWNAYEKIEIEQIKIAVGFESNSYFYGYIIGDIFYVSSMESYAISVNNSGIVLDTQAYPEEMVFNQISGSLQRAGYNVSSTSPNEVIVDVNEQIENWNEYQIIPK